MKLSKRIMISVGVLDLALAAFDLYALKNWQPNLAQQALGWTLVVVTVITAVLLFGIAAGSRIVRGLFVAGVLFAISVSIPAQYPRFIGASDPSVMLITPKHRITVWTGGFSSPHPKWVKRKTLNTCLANELPEASCIAAQEYARLLTSDGELAVQIDDAADHVIAVWGGCGEPYASFARRFDFSRITVTVRDTIFQQPGTGVWCGGLTADGGRSITVVNLFFQPYFSDRSHAGLATMRAFADYELGNSVTWAFLGHVRDTGDAPPCR